MVAPRLSVITMVDEQRERSARALEALLAQSLPGEMEILLVDFGGADETKVRGSDHPAVRVVRPPRGSGHGQALALAVELARAPLVAFVEEHVIVLDGWAEALVLAHEGPWAAVSSEMHPSDLDRPVARRIELVSRNTFSAPAARGEALTLRCQNICYKRARLIELGTRLPLFLSNEGLLLKQLRRQGERLFVESRARMVHAHEKQWGPFLVASFHSARLSAAAAVELSGPARQRRFGELVRHATGALRWPFTLWRRTRSLPNAERWLPVFYRNLPHVFSYYGAHALGGILGSLAGMGPSSSEILKYELNAEREPPDTRAAESAGRAPLETP